MKTKPVPNKHAHAQANGHDANASLAATRSWQNRAACLAKRGQGVKKRHCPFGRHTADAAVEVQHGLQAPSIPSTTREAIATCTQPTVIQMAWLLSQQTHAAPTTTR